MSWIRRAFRAFARRGPTSKDRPSESPSLCSIDLKAALPINGGPGDAVRTQTEFEAALSALGWQLDRPQRTPGGWKATIRRGTTSILTTGSTVEEVLESLLRDVEGREKQPQEQP
jgi:hypothetical protein